MCNIYTSFSDNIDDCNVLIIQDNAVKQNNRTDISMEDLHQLKESVDSLVWLDTTDSTGTIHSEALSLVDSYLKKQLLNDRQRYLEPMYGRRPYTHFYHQNFGIDDGEKYSEEPKIPVNSEGDLDKLELAWHIGLLPNFPYINPLWYTLDALPNIICQKLPWEKLFSTPKIWYSPKESRSIDVSGRFSTNYDRGTVEFHRIRMAKIFEDHLETGRVSPMEYWKEIRNSKILLSPFGYGEICHRDFEGFLSGNLLLKPNVSHIKTWPPLFENNETYIGISWKMDSAIHTVDTISDQYNEYRDIAVKGQKRYSKYLIGETAKKQFVDHFENMIKNCTK
jgi:hypothetical protein